MLCLFDGKPLSWRFEEHRHGPADPRPRHDERGGAHADGPHLRDPSTQVCSRPWCGPTTDAEDAAVFGIVRGSENELDLLNKAMYLLRERLITPLLNSLAFIAREKAIRTAKAA